MDGERPFLQITNVQIETQTLQLKPRFGHARPLDYKWFQFDVRPDKESIFIHSDSSQPGYDVLGEYLFNFEKAQERCKEEYLEFVKWRKDFTQLRQLREDNPVKYEVVFENIVRALVGCNHMWKRIFGRQLASKRLSKNDDGLSSVWDEQQMLVYNLINNLPPLEPSLMERTVKY